MHFFYNALLRASYSIRLLGDWAQACRYHTVVRCDLQPFLTKLKNPVPFQLKALQLHLFFLLNTRGTVEERVTRSVRPADWPHWPAGKNWLAISNPNLSPFIAAGYHLLRWLTFPAQDQDEVWIRLFFSNDLAILFRSDMLRLLYDFSHRFPRLYRPRIRREDAIGPPEAFGKVTSR